MVIGMAMKVNRKYRMSEDVLHILLGYDGNESHNRTLC